MTGGSGTLSSNTFSFDTVPWFDYNSVETHLSPRLIMPRRKQRAEVSREYGHPWPWKVEELLREEYHRLDGDFRKIGEAFGCHPRTVGIWVRRYEINLEERGR